MEAWSLQKHPVELLLNALWPQPESQLHSDAFRAFWIAFGVGAIVMYPILLLLRRSKSKSLLNPYAPEGHVKKAGTPTMGGIAILVSLFAGSAGLMPLGLILCLVGLALVGFVDDYVVPRYTAKRGLGWLPKLVLEFVAAALMFLGQPFSFNTVVGMFVIVAFANAVNFADGLDALAGTLLLFAFLVFGVFFILQGNGVMACLSMAACGGLLPFLFVNAPPAKVFMGDVGSLPLGGLLGVLFLAAPYKTASWPWIVNVIFAIELLLVPLQIGAVKLIKRRIFPATPIHHGFEKMGWPEANIVWTFVLAQIALSAAALTEMLSRSST